VNSAAAFLATIRALGSLVGPRLDADLLARPYSKSTMAVWRLPNSAVLFQQAVWLVVRFLDTLLLCISSCFVILGELMLCSHLLTYCCIYSFNRQSGLLL
jgi:hypothetical protein